ncbi:MAG TPA: DUF1638 domain-containing protein [Anaerolineales bacterium]|nr:DUF1638 domain-containing protein [Anaerolineales bacterium]
MIEATDTRSESAFDKRIKVIACATVIEEMLPLLPPHVAYQVLDFGLHLHPDELRRTLQAAIDESSQVADTILLGYGLCSRAVEGLRATACTLVVPRVDDCIAIFLGSRASYKQQASAEPGTYYLTKGWIEVGDSPFEEYKRLVARYGEQRAERMVRLALKNYTRLAFINTGEYDLERYRDYARRMSERFGLRYEEIAGSSALVKKMIYGPWDDEFIVIPPGQVITYDHFVSLPPCNPSALVGGSP